MPLNILITGASGYIGGTILARWKSANLPPHGIVYALVRSDEQGQAVKQYGAEPLFVDLKDLEQMKSTIIEKEIGIVYYLIDAYHNEVQKAMIAGLGEVKNTTGQDVHLLHTTGAKSFGSHAGVYADAPLLDTDSRLYEQQKTVISPHEWFTQFMLTPSHVSRTNAEIIDAAEESGVRTYIFTPCIVYGEGEGFGNRTSIQDVAIVKSAKAAGRVYRVDANHPTWPVCHVIDTANLYLQIMQCILQGEPVGHGKNGFFLAASGSIPWDDIYAAFAAALAKRGVIDDAEVNQADDSALEKMGKALGVSPSVVPIQLGGKCTLTAVHGIRMGWKPQYPPEHILEMADAEVELILQGIQS